MPQGQQLPQGWSVVPSAPPPASPPPPAPPVTGGLGQTVQPGSPTLEGQLVSGVKNFAQTVNPWNLVEGTAQLAYHPIDSVQGYHETQNRLFNAAKDSFAKGDLDTAFMHFKNYMLNAVPGLGSGLEAAEDKMRAGDYGGGIGMGLGMGVNASVGARPGLIGEAASGVASGAKVAANAAKANALPVAVGAGAKALGFSSHESLGLALASAGIQRLNLSGFLNEALDFLRTRRGADATATPASRPPARARGAGPAATSGAPAPRAATPPVAPIETSPATPAVAPPPRTPAASTPPGALRLSDLTPEEVNLLESMVARGESESAAVLHLQRIRSGEKVHPSTPMPTPDPASMPLTRADLTPEELTELTKYVAAGQPEDLVLDLIRQFREGRHPAQRVPPKASPVSTPATRAKTKKEIRSQQPSELPTSERGTPQLNAAEGLEYSRLRKFGNSHEQAIEMIVSQRAFLNRMGLEAPETVRLRVNERNRTGRWDDER